MPTLMKRAAEAMPAAPSSAPPLASLEGVTRRLGRRAVLQDVSLRLAHGESIALVGLNGAGKTTLLRVLLGLLPPSRGRALLCGRPAVEAGSRARVIFLPERVAPDRAVPLGVWMRHTLRLCGAPAQRAAVARECALLGVEPGSLDRPGGRVSKGEAQKAALAVTLLSGRDFIVYDEPMSGLDPLARALLRERLLRLRKENPGVTLLFSTHLPGDLGALCRRVVVLHRARVRFDGPLREFAAAYRTCDLEQAFLRCIAT